MAKKSAFKLTARHERFCQLYAADPERNATRAFIDAGYSKATACEGASRLLANVKTKGRIAELWGDLPTPTQRVFNINAEFILTGLADIAINGKNEQARTRCYELLGKTAQGGMLFTDRTLDVKPTLRDLPDDQLMELIDQAKAQLGQPATAPVPADTPPPDRATDEPDSVPLQ